MNEIAIVFCMTQESGDGLSKAEQSTEPPACQCQRLRVECQQLREQLSDEQTRRQKLHDQMLWMSRKSTTDEQVCLESSQSSNIFICTLSAFICIITH